jgi:hydroxypyruvate reductase
LGLAKRAPFFFAVREERLHSSHIFTSEASRRARRDLVQIYRAAVAAVDPAALVCRHLRAEFATSQAGRLLVVGGGKAAARMAAGCEAALGPRVIGGLVIVPDGCGVALEVVTVRSAGHPIPDQRGVAATAELCRILSDASAPAVLCVVSGGASSVLVSPRAPVTLEEKMNVSRLLLACGADIEEFNTVRKHLSSVKGGGLLRIGTTRPLVTLVLSDVIGDDPSVIGSGPTTPDASSFADALAILRKHALVDHVAASVRSVLERGASGALPETVKPGDPEADGASTTVIGNNRLALQAAAEAARRLGYEPYIDATTLVGDTAAAARHWLHGVRRRIDGSRACVIAGGETTVVVRGQGRGGRNQEFALALVEPIAGASAVILSAGTDGIDGPTDAAGAFVDGETLGRARAVGLDDASALADNDSYSFFARLDDLLRCGPTGTNVMDIKLAIGVPSSA